MSTTIASLPTLPSIGLPSTSSVDLESYANQFASLAGTAVNYSPTATSTGNSTLQSAESTASGVAHAAQIFAKVSTALANLGLEDYIFLLIGAALIIVGLATFRGAQSIVVSTGNTATRVAKTIRRGAEATAEVAS